MNKVRTAMMFLLLLGVPTALAQFTDTQDSSYRGAIDYLQSRDLISGFPDGTFRPHQAMTRAEFLALVVRASGNSDSPVGGQCLAAFAPGDWYAPVMCQGLALELVTGTPDALRPGDTVIYSEALKMLLLAFGFEPEPAADGPWHTPYVTFAADNGILSTLAYRPGDFVIRETAANMLYRTMVLAGRFVQTGPTRSEPMPDPAPQLPGAESTAPAEAAPAATPEPEPVPQVQAACPLTLPEPPGTLSVAGTERSLLTHLPAAAGQGEPLPLIIVFHGRTNSNSQVRRYMRLEGNGEDAIIVYPAGLPAGGNARNWNDPGDHPTELRDYEFFDAIVGHFSKRYCIDPERIFVVGHSLGAYFANSVACSRPDVVRAVATVAGGIQRSNCEGKVAALLFHNPNDTLVAISEGESARDTFLAANGLSGVQANPLSDAFNCSVYGDANPGHSVTWCVHNIDRPYGNTYDPHSWPSSIGPYVMQYFGRF